MSMKEPKPLPVAHPSSTDGLVRELRDEMREGFHTLETTMLELGQKVVNVEARLDEVDGRLMRNSSQVKGASRTDMQHEAAIAALSAKLDENTASTAEAAASAARIEKVVTGFFKHPAFIALVLALASFATAWLGRHTP